MIDLNSSTGKTLKHGIFVGICTLALGLIVMAFSEDIGEKILWLGVGIMVFIPLVSIFVSALALYLEKDMYWFRCTLALIAISFVGMYFALAL